MRMQTVLHCATLLDWGLRVATLLALPAALARGLLATPSLQRFSIR
jgi:hypothetical protein